MSLRAATFSATRWISAAVIARAGIQFAQTAVLARLLTPSDFGLMVIAGAAASVASLLADMGLSSAVMHFPRPDSRTWSTLYWINLSLAILLAAIYAIAAVVLADALHQPQLISLMWWLSASFPLAALGQPFRVLAEKDLHFRPLAQQEVLAALAGMLAAVSVALSTKGPYALVVFPLVSTACSSAMAWFWLAGKDKPSATFAFDSVRPFIGFGLHRVGDSLWNTLRMQADVFIAGLIAAPATVAAYSVPRDLCLKVSNSFVNPVVTRVGLPVMSRLQGNPDALRSVYLQTLRMTASLNFPAYALLALFPDQFIMLFLGDQWSNAGVFLRIFAIWGLIRSTGNPSGSLLYAVGMAKRAHLWNAALFLATVPIMWGTALVAGLDSLAWMMLALQIIIFVLAWKMLIYPACGVGFSAYCGELLPPAFATVLASGMSYFTVQTVAAGYHLPLGVTVFVGTYLAMSWWFNRSWAIAMWEVVTPKLRSLQK